MKTYLDCLKKNGSTSTECRHLSRDYLNCRMEKCVVLSSWWRCATDAHGIVGLWARMNGRILDLRRRRRTEHYHPVQRAVDRHDIIRDFLSAGFYVLYAVPSLCLDFNRLASRTPPAPARLASSRPILRDLDPAFRRHFVVYSRRAQQYIQTAQAGPSKAAPSCADARPKLLRTAISRERVFVPTSS